MNLDNKNNHGTKENPIYVVAPSNSVWEISKALFLMGGGVGLHYAYQKWIAQPKEESPENKEKLLELHIKEAHLIQNHEEALTKFLRCEEKGFNEKFCKDMFNVHQQALDRITTKDFVFNKNNANQKLS